MSDRSTQMRLAILHAPGDEALAADLKAERGFADALTATLGARLAFGDQLVLLVLWTERASACGDALRALLDDHRAVVLWRQDGVVPAGFADRVDVLDRDSSASAIASALRLAEMERDRPVDAPVRRRMKGGITAAVVGIAITTAVGAAAAAAVMMDREAPLALFAAQPHNQPASTPNPDLRPTSRP